jgi:hypothetical protein
MLGVLIPSSDPNETLSKAPCQVFSVIPFLYKCLVPFFSLATTYERPCYDLATKSAKTYLWQVKILVKGIKLPSDA